MKLQSKILLSIARWLPRGYWRIASLAAKNDQALWDIRLPIKAVANAEIRADLRESVYMPIFKHGCFTHQVGENRLCMALIKPGDIVYDVGANIGYTTLLFSHAVGATGTVIAFEPAPRIFRLLTRSLASMENVECLNLAVSSTEGEASFYEAKSLDT
jgi:predicted O-methyltransferase YrrM